MIDMATLLAGVFGLLLLAAIAALLRQRRRLAELRTKGAARGPATSDGREATLPETMDPLDSQLQPMGPGLWEWDLVQKKLSVSDQFIAGAGYSSNELGVGINSYLRLVHPEDAPLIRNRFEKYLARAIPECDLEFRIRYRDGHYRWIHTRALATWDGDGKPQKVTGSLADISDRVLAEEERDRHFNLSLDMLGVAGYDGFLQQVNPAWVRVLGWSRDDLMADPILFFIHPEDQETFQEGAAQLEMGRPVEDLRARFRCRDGSYKWLSWNSFPYPDRSLVFSVVRDITSQKAAEAKVLEYQDRLRSLSNQLSLVEDRQRRELAAAIHDGLAQQLFGLRAKVTLLKYPDKLDDFRAVVNEAIEILDDTMEGARSLAFELFPAELHEVGLEAALGWMAHDFEERNGVKCGVTVEGEGEELSDDLRAMAYQCVRELLANVKKHAEAREVDITLNHVEGFLTIVVEDDGTGFDLSWEESRSDSRRMGHEGFGLFSIRERLRSVEGRMLVDSRLGQGCRVFLSFPESVIGS